MILTIFFLLIQLTTKIKWDYASFKDSQSKFSRPIINKIINKAKMRNKFPKETEI